MNKLWYQQPASLWTEMLPLGNGHIGAMADGGVHLSSFLLNDDTLWSGYPKDMHILQDNCCYEKAKELTLAKDYKRATEIIEKNMLGGWTQAYLPLGNLKIAYLKNKNVSVENYCRKLNLKNACHTVDYTVSGVKICEESFISSPNDALYINISSSKEKFLSCEIFLDSLLKYDVCVHNNMIMLDGIAPSNVEPNYVNCPEDKAVIYSEKDSEKGMLFGAYAKIDTKDGNIKCTKNSIIAENATTITIILSTKTSFNTPFKNPYMNGIDYKKYILDNIELADAFSVAKEKHIKDYCSYYDRLSFSLIDTEKKDMATDKRLKQFINDKSDIELSLLLFNYGRYLFISSSRENTQATNLQGIWSKDLRAPWSANYTLNINAEMNYWLAEPCSLSELHMPLFDLIKGVCEKGKITAKKYYGAKGTVVHHNTDIWRHTTPVGNGEDGSSVYGFWNLGTGWLANHIYEHYTYTLDKNFIKDMFPFMKNIAKFYNSLVIKNEEGNYFLPMSTSPENYFIYEDNVYSICETTTMTTGIVKEVFKNFLFIVNELQIKDEIYDDIKDKFNNFIPYKIGEDGRLLEWSEYFKETDPLHRHISHLYPLFPGSEFNFSKTPNFMKACEKSLAIRGDDGTGWSLGWKINLFAKLRKGDHALKLIERQLRLVEMSSTQMHSGGGTYKNLFDAHPPFQIDGNFGVVSGVCHMLAESHMGEVYLLYALPKKWHTGEVKGLKIKGNITLNMKWENMKLIYATFLSPISQTLKVYFGDTNKNIKIIKNVEHSLM